MVCYGLLRCQPAKLHLEKLLITGKVAEGGVGLTSLDYIQECTVCCEEFTLDGDHIPRILPCSHILCEKCIKDLLQGGNVVCPQWREKFPTQNVAESFPQNNYVLPIIRRKTKNAQVNVEQRKEVCEEHGREIALFCNEPCCKKSMCQLCMIQKHKTHDFVDL